jgi:hypothetical protein
MLIGWEEYNYFINCTAVQLMIFPKQAKWRKGILLNTSVKWNCPRGTRWKYVQKVIKAPNFALTQELNENTDKSTKVWLKDWQDWALAREYDVDTRSIQFCHANNSPRQLVQFWQNFQTSLVLLIPNCMSNIAWLPILI